jgi:hypothetical protein
LIQDIAIGISWCHGRTIGVAKVCQTQSVESKGMAQFMHDGNNVATGGILPEKALI